MKLQKVPKKAGFCNRLQKLEPIKVVIGIRRCGKSSLLKLMAAHLRENGVHEDQIIEMNFESFEYKDMSA